MAEQEGDRPAVRPPVRVRGIVLSAFDPPAQRREKLARIAFDGMTRFVALLDDEGRVIDVTPAALAAAGTALADVQGEWFWDTIWWQVSEPVTRALRDAIVRAAQGESMRWDTLISGIAGVVEATISPVADDDGRVAFLVAEFAPGARSIPVARPDTTEGTPALLAPVTAVPAERVTLDALTLRILIADDNRDNADSFAALLDLLGHDVRTAYSGLEAVAVADVFRPQVLLLDIGMPGADGYEVARRIRGRSWGRAALLVAVTGRDQDEDIRLAEAAGFDHHFSKPVSLDRLEPLLREFAQR